MFSLQSGALFCSLLQFAFRLKYSFNHDHDHYNNHCWFVSALKFCFCTSFETSSCCLWKQNALFFFLFSSILSIIRYLLLLLFIVSEEVCKRKEEAAGLYWVCFYWIEEEKLKRKAQSWHELDDAADAGYQQVDGLKSNYRCQKKN